MRKFRSSPSSFVSALELLVLLLLLLLLLSTAANFTQVVATPPTTIARPQAPIPCSRHQLAKCTSFSCILLHLLLPAFFNMCAMCSASTSTVAAPPRTFRLPSLLSSQTLLQVCSLDTVDIVSNKLAHLSNMSCC